MVNKKLRATWVFPWTSLSQGTRRFQINVEGTQLVTAKTSSCITKRVIITKMLWKSSTKTFSIDIRKTKGIDRIFSHRYNRRESERKGPACRRTKENSVKRRTARGKRQQVDQTPLPPPSIPISRQRKIGIENMFVDKNGELPHNRIIALAVARLERLAKWT